MELIPGGTLTQLVCGSVDAGPLPDPVARRFFKQIAEAVAHAHSRGIAHRDLKVRGQKMARLGESDDQPPHPTWVPLQSCLALSSAAA